MAIRQYARKTSLPFASVMMISKAFPFGKCKFKILCRQLFLQGTFSQIQTFRPGAQFKSLPYTLKLLNVNIPELYQTWRAHPLTIFFTSVMLQPDRSFFGNSGNLGIFNYSNAIEFDGHPVALHGDLKCIPLADVFVGIHFWS